MRKILFVSIQFICVKFWFGFVIKFWLHTDAPNKSNRREQQTVNSTTVDMPAQKSDHFLLFSQWNVVFNFTCDLPVVSDYSVFGFCFLGFVREHFLWNLLSVSNCHNHQYFWLMKCQHTINYQVASANKFQLNECRSIKQKSTKQNQIASKWMECCLFSALSFNLLSSDEKNGSNFQN